MHELRWLDCNDYESGAWEECGRETTVESSNLAAEYYVASLLLRLGYVVTVTFGNTKEIDLIVYDPATKKTVTIDVKGLKNTSNWVMPSEKKLVERPSHFYVLVAFKNKIEQLEVSPEVYTIPSTAVRRLWRSWSGRPDVKNINYRDVKNKEELKGEAGFEQLFGSRGSSTKS